MLNATIDTISQVAVVVTLTNPTLIVGLPIDEKFGLNPPASGVFNQGQAERLRALVPVELLPHLLKLAESDPESAAVIDWIRTRPDLTEEDVKEQLRRSDEEVNGETI